MNRVLILLCCLLASACDYLPRDPDGTLQRVRQSGVFRVGLVGQDPRAAALIVALEQRTHARAELRAMAAEPALQELDEGKVDLVLGPFLRDTPWSSDAAFGPPLSVSGSKDAPMEYKAAVRNGENRWLMAVERASRAISAEARAQ